MKMICESTGSVLNVDRHYMTKNFWEYYLEKPEENGQAFGLVMGHETELGYVDIEEIKPYVMSSVNPEHDEILPAEGWRWQEKENE